MSHFSIYILAIATNFCPIQSDLSGNANWLKVSGFQNLAKIDHFKHVLYFCQIKSDLSGNTVWLQVSGF